MPRLETSQDTNVLGLDINNTTTNPFITTEIDLGLGTISTEGEMTEEANRTVGEKELKTGEITPEKDEGDAYEKQLDMQIFKGVGFVTDVMDAAVKGALGQEVRYHTLSPTVETVSKAAGVFGRELLLTFMSYGTVNSVVKGLSGVKWLSKAANATKYVPTFVKEGVIGAAAGTVKAEYSKLFEPDIDTYDKAISAAQFGGGDAARSLVETILKKTPLNPVVTELISYTADVVGGSAVALGIHGDVDEFAKEVIAPQAAVMGVLDLLLFAVKKKKINLSKSQLDDLLTIKENLEEGKISVENATQKLNSITEGLDVDVKQIGSDYYKDVEENLNKMKEEVSSLKEQVKAETTKEQENYNKAEAVSKVKEKVPEDASAVPIVTPAKDNAPINTTKINSEPEVIKEVYDMAKAIEDAKGKDKLSFDEVKERLEKQGEKLEKLDSDSLVKELGLDIKQAKQLAEALQTAPEQVLKYRETIINLGYSIQRQAKYIKELQAKGEKIDPKEEIKLIQLLNLQYDLTSSFKDISTKVAQALAIHRVDVNGELLDFSKIVDSDILKSPDAQSILEAFESGKLDKAELNKWVKFISSTKDVGAINRALNKQPFFKRFIDFLVDYKAMNVLSNFNVHKRNVASQLAHQVHDLAIDTVAAGINTVLRKGSEGITFNQVLNKTIGFIDGVNRAFFRPLVSTKDVYGVLHGKQAPSAVDMMKLMLFNPKEFNKLSELTQLDRPRAEIEHIQGATAENLFGTMMSSNTFMRGISIALDFFLGHMRTLSYGLLKATDQPFAYGAYFGEIRAKLAQQVDSGVLTKQQAKKYTDLAGQYRAIKMILPAMEKYAKVEKGLTGKEAITFIKSMLEVKDFDSKVIDMVIAEKIDPVSLKNNKDYELISSLDKVGVYKAADMTWKTDLEWGVNREIEKVLNTYKPLKLIQLFYHTPAKILEYGFQTGGLTPKYWKQLFTSKNVAERERAAATLAFSGMLYLVGVQLYMQNRLTPTARNAEERRLMSEAGIPDNAIRIKDTWVDINALNPIPSLTFTSMANLMRAIEEAKDPDEEEKAKQMLASFLLIMANNTLNKTWFQSLSDFIDALQGTNTEDYIQNFGQSLIPFYGVVKYVHQQYDKYLIDFNNSVLRGAPVLDSYGKPILQWDYKFGLRTSDARRYPKDSWRREAGRLGYVVPHMNKTIEGVKLTEEQYWHMLDLINTKYHLEESLDSLVKSPRYQKLPDKYKRQKVDSIVRDIQNKAREDIKRTLISEGKIQEKLKKEREELKKPPAPSKWFGE